jgi:hypothetical protein
VSDSLLGPPTKIKHLDADGAGWADFLMLQGLTTRTVMVTSRRKKEPVILWGDTLCSLLGVLDELGLQPAAVILLSLDAVHWMQFIWFKELLELNDLLELPLILKKCYYPCCGENAGWALLMPMLLANFCRLVTLLVLSCLIGTTCVWHKFYIWESDSMSLRHCEVGGIMTTTLTQECCLS